MHLCLRNTTFDINMHIDPTPKGGGGNSIGGIIVKLGRIEKQCHIEVLGVIVQEGWRCPHMGVLRKAVEAARQYSTEIILGKYGRHKLSIQRCK